MYPRAWCRWVFGMGWLLVFGLLGIGVPASARAESLAVLGLTSEDGDDGLAASVTKAVRTAAEEHGSYEVSSSQVSLAQMTMAQDCEISDAQCRIAVASALKSERVIYGSLTHVNRRTYEVELHMASGRDGTEQRASRTFSARDTSDATFARIARELLAELRGESPTPAEASAASPAVATVAPDIEPLEERESDREPAAVPDDGAPASNDWIGYTLIGVAVVSTAMTAFSWMQIDKAENDPSLRQYRRAVDPEVSDACDEAKNNNAYGVGPNVLADARAACRQGRTFEVLQFVFLGAAVASAGVGTYFLLDDESPDQAAAARPGLALVPHVSTRGGSLDLRVRF